MDTATAAPAVEEIEGLTGGLPLLVLFLIALGIYLVFVAIWYLPLFIKHRRIKKERARHYVAAFFLGTAAVIAAILAQTGMIAVLPNSLPKGVPGIICGFFRIMLTVGVSEELLKFFAGRLVIRKIPDLNEAGCMLLFGAVGLGFETLETLATGMASPLAVAVRCVTALHIFLQLYMGKFWWRALEAKRAGDIPRFLKERRKALLIPILIHTVFDYPILKIDSMTEEVDDTVALLCVIGAVVFAVVCVIMILISANRTLKAEKAAHEAEALSAPAEGVTEP